MNKKGEVGPIEVLVGVIIILVVLFAIIYFFFPNFWAQINILSPTKVNVDKMALNCQTTCKTSQTNYDYCCVPKSVVLKDGEKAKQITCDDPLLSANSDCTKVCDFEVDCKSAICPSDNVKTTCSGSETDVTSDKIWKSDKTLLAKDEKCCESKTELQQTPPTA